MIDLEVIAAIAILIVVIIAVAATRARRAASRTPIETVGRNRLDIESRIQELVQAENAEKSELLRKRRDWETKMDPVFRMLDELQAEFAESTQLEFRHRSEVARLDDYLFEVDTSGYEVFRDHSGSGEIYRVYYVRSGRVEDVRSFCLDVIARRISEMRDGRYRGRPKPISMN